MKHDLKKYFSKLTFRNTSFEKGTGLMFKKSFIDECYIFPFAYEKKIPITMLFVFFPIDVVWTNLEGEVVDLRRNAKPFVFNIYHKGKASNLIEMPVGSIDKFKIKLMDKVTFQNEQEWIVFYN